MRAYFERLAGADPARSEWLEWESEDGEVRLSVRPHGAHAQLAVSMRWPPDWNEQPLGGLMVQMADLHEFAAGMSRLTAE